MSYLLKELALLLLGWVIFVQTRNWLHWRGVKKLGDANACEDPPALPNKLPGGIERYSLVLFGYGGLDVLDDIIREAYSKLGNTYRVYGLFNYSHVSTCEPANVQAILATKFHDFDIGYVRHNNFSALIGSGVFTSEGEAWQHYRGSLKPQFTRDQISDLDVAEAHLRVLFRALPETDAGGWVRDIDIMPYISRFAMDASTEFLFGQSVNSQSATLHAADSGNSLEMRENADFAEAMTYAQDYIGWRIRLQSLYWLANSRKFQQACQTVKVYANKCVDRALDPANKRSKPESGMKEKFVLLESLATYTQDANELRDQMLQLLLAGRDALSGAIVWAILSLSCDPKEYATLRNAVLFHFGTYSQPNSDNEMSFASLKACKPLYHVIYEALRLYPAIPLNGRVALRDTFLPVGGGKDGKSPVAVRKGEAVGFCAYAMHRRKDIWGEDADEFRPARWEGKKLGWEFVGFSGGPRVCLGQQYALTEASYVLARFVQRFDRIEAVNFGGKLPKKLGLLLLPGKGANIRLHKAID